MVRISYYDVESGYIYYTSEVIPHLECRVLDCVKDKESAEKNIVRALQFDDSGTKGLPQSVRDRFLELLDEGIGVSHRGLDFMDRIMTRSPARDGKKWIESERDIFLAQREERQLAWRTQQ